MANNAKKNEEKSIKHEAMDIVEAYHRDGTLPEVTTPEQLKTLAGVYIAECNQHKLNLDATAAGLKLLKDIWPLIAKGAIILGVKKVDCLVPFMDGCKPASLILNTSDKGCFTHEYETDDDALKKLQKLAKENSSVFTEDLMKRLTKQKTVLNKSGIQHECKVNKALKAQLASIKINPDDDEAVTTRIECGVPMWGEVKPYGEAKACVFKAIVKSVGRRLFNKFSSLPKVGTDAENARKVAAA